MRIHLPGRGPLLLSLAGLAFVATSIAQTNAPLTPALYAVKAQTSHPAGLVPASSGRGASIQENYARLPLSFEANQGQTDPRVRFTSRGSGYSLFLTDASAVLALTGADTTAHTATGHRINAGNILGADRKTHSETKTEVVRMELLRANPNPRVSGENQLPGAANYLLGNDSKNWRTGVPTYSEVRYTSVYPGVDLVYYGNQRQLEYDFVVAPNANPARIAIHFAGATRLSVTASGDLAIDAGNVQIAFHKPVLYQDIDNRRQAVPGRFTLLANNSVGFAIGSYDHSASLVIDPILGYSTYLGGDQIGFAAAIAVDGSGNAYVTGYTQAANFPTTTGALQTTYAANSSNTAFVTKLNPSGSALVYSTYLGGNSYSAANAIAVDSSGNAYVAGFTECYDFPVTPGAFRTTNPGQIGSVFVTKLTAAGSALLYSTYLGGSNYDAVYGIAIDSSGDAYLGGFAASTDFPVTPGAFQTTNNEPDLNDGTNDGTGFVAELNPAGTAEVYSTFLGGSGNGHNPFGEQVNAIAIDSSGSAYVVGYTLSSDFPVTANSISTTNQTTGGTYTGFVTKLNASGSALVYSTYLGGSEFSIAWAVAVDAMGDAYVSGGSDGGDFPTTPGAFQIGGNPYGQLSPFVSKFNSSGSALLYSTFVGGSGEANYDNQATGLAIDSSGDAWITGGTTFSNFPTTLGAFQTTNAAAAGGPNAFLTELNPAGSAVLYSTYLGGSISDAAEAIALDSASNVYISGLAYSTNFPTTPGAYSSTNLAAVNNSADAFVAKFSPGSMPITPTCHWSNPGPVGYGYLLGPNQLNATCSVAGTYTYNPPAGTGLSPGVHTLSVLFTPNDTATYTSANASVSITINPAVLTVTAQSKSMTYGAAVPALPYVISGLKFGQTASVLSAMPTVTTTATSGSGVGAYPIVVNVAGITAPNYIVVAGPGSFLTVNQATLTAKATSTTAVFDQPIPALNYTLNGFLNGDTAAVLSGTAAVSTTAVQGSPTGNYPIVFSTQTLSATNYKLAYDSGTLRILP